jgi:hypothetical protein
MPPTDTTLASATYRRPELGDFAPYYDRYISLVHTGDPASHTSNDILAILEEQRRQTLLLLCGRAEADGDFRYAPDKWTLKEVIGHLNDTECVMSYRALRISRADQTPLAGFEQDDYVRNGPFAHNTLPDLIEDYIAVRRATISLFRNLDEAAWTRRGSANNHEVTVRALAWIIAGHELHHKKIVEEKYLKS